MASTSLEPGKGKTDAVIHGLAQKHMPGSPTWENDERREDFVDNYLTHQAVHAVGLLDPIVKAAITVSSR